MSPTVSFIIIIVFHCGCHFDFTKEATFEKSQATWATFKEFRVNFKGKRFIAHNVIHPC